MEGRNLSFSPMENLPKRAYVKKFTIGERWCYSAREASSRGEGVKRERGIEPPYTAWKAVALPLCYSRIGVLGVEPRPHPPKGCVLPLYYTPFPQ